MPAGRKEFSLVVACCIWPRSERRAEAIRAASTDIDWARLLRVARRQRVEALVLDGLGQAGIAPPASVLAALEVRAARIAWQNGMLAAESLRLQKQFDDAGIDSLILKGVTLSVLGYDDEMVKAAWDIDLLVGPDAAERGVAALETAGYVLIDPEGLNPAQFKTYLARARECHFAKDRMFVELKWRLNDNPELLKGVSFSSSRQLVKLGETQFLSTLGKDDLFAYLCVHGANHCWARLKWLADLGALLARETPEERERLYRAAEARGAGPCAAQGLLLCRRLLRTELPSALAAELEGDWRAHWLAAAALFAMRAGENDPGIDRRLLPQISTGLSHFLLGRGWRFLMVEMHNKWVSHVHVPLLRWAQRWWR